MVHRSGGKLSSSHCWDALAVLDGSSWSLLIPESSCISGRGGSLWNLFVTWASDDHQEWNLHSPLLLAVVLWFSFKLTAARCVVWSELHAGGMLLIDRLQNNIFCICTEQVGQCGWQQHMLRLCLPRLRFDLVGPPLLYLRWKETLWVELAEILCSYILGNSNTTPTQ